MAAPAHPLPDTGRAGLGRPQASQVCLGRELPWGLLPCNPASRQGRAWRSRGLG